MSSERTGIVNDASARRAVDVVHGRTPIPDRDDVDAWFEAVDAARNAIYPPH